MAKRIDSNQLAFDFDAPVADAVDPIAAGWAALRRFHAAVVNFNPDEQKAARADFDAAASLVNGDCLAAQCDALSSHLAAKPGTKPLFGQPFTRIVEIAGAQVEVRYDGLGSLGFMNCHAVNWDADFISSTGSRSVMHTPGYGSLNARGYGVLGQVMEHVVARINADIADKKGNVHLVPIEQQWRDIHFGTYRLAA